MICNEGTRLASRFALSACLMIASFTLVQFCPNSWAAEQKPQPAPVTAGPTGGNWPMFRLNPEHTASLILHSAQPFSGKKRWIFLAQGGIDSSPAIYNGLIYVGCDDLSVYA